MHKVFFFLCLQEGRNKVSDLSHEQQEKKRRKNASLLTIFFIIQDFFMAYYFPCVQICPFFF